MKDSMDWRAEYAQMRLVSDMTGRVFEPQAKSLTVLATVLCGRVTVEFDQNEKTMTIKGKKFVSPESVGKLSVSMKKLLGNSWKLNMVTPSRVSWFSKLKRWFRWTISFPRR